MSSEQQRLNIRRYIANKFTNDVTGHDFFHMERVANMAKLLAISEKADTFICEMAGWVHDIGDHKLFDDPPQEMKKLNDFFHAIDLTDEQIKAINKAIQDVSFSGGHKSPETLEGKIVQDADRLDAIGAIGIARTFAYGGANHQLIDHPSQKEGTSIQHFYDKLLLLKDKMNTDGARKIADKRHRILTHFLEQFHDEWTN